MVIVPMMETAAVNLAATVVFAVQLQFVRLLVCVPLMRSAAVHIHATTMDIVATQRRPPVPQWTEHAQ